MSVIGYARVALGPVIGECCEESGSPPRTATTCRLLLRDCSRSEPVFRSGVLPERLLLLGDDRLDVLHELQIRLVVTEIAIQSSSIHEKPAPDPGLFRRPAQAS
jgi:hypothetical protein